MIKICILLFSFLGFMFVGGCDSEENKEIVLQESMNTVKKETEIESLEESAIILGSSENYQEATEREIQALMDSEEYQIANVETRANLFEKLLEKLIDEGAVEKYEINLEIRPAIIDVYYKDGSCIGILLEDFLKDFN